MAFKEFSFSVDDFQNPKVYKDSEAMCTLLVRLLLLEPGTIQSHPEAGVGLMSKYAYSIEDDVSGLKTDFQKQIETYLPDFQGVTVNVKLKNKVLYIGVEIDGTIYGIYYDENTSSITTNYIRLADL